MGSSKQGWDVPGHSGQLSQAAVSIHSSLRNIPQIRSLLQQPSQARTQGRTTRTWCGWLRKPQVTNSRARSSIPFGGLPKCLDPPWAGRESIPGLQLGKSLLGELEGLQQGWKVKCGWESVLAPQHEGMRKERNGGMEGKQSTARQLEPLHQCHPAAQPQTPGTW